MGKIMEFFQTQRKLALGAVAGIVAILVIIGIYSSGNASGTWGSSALEKDMASATAEKIGAKIANNNAGADALVVDPVVKLKISGSKADITVSYRVDADAFITAYNQSVEAEYQSIIAESQAQADASGTTLEEVLQSAYGESYESQIRSSFPTEESVRSNLELAIATYAESQGMTYNKKTNILSLKTTAKVSSLSHKFSKNGKAVKLGLAKYKLSTYRRSGKSLIVKVNGKNYTFTTKSK